MRFVSARVPPHVAYALGQLNAKHYSIISAHPCPDEPKAQSIEECCLHSLCLRPERCLIGKIKGFRCPRSNFYWVALLSDPPTAWIEIDRWHDGHVLALQGGLPAEERNGNTQRHVPTIRDPYSQEAGRVFSIGLVMGDGYEVCRCLQPGSGGPSRKQSKSQ